MKQLTDFRGKRIFVQVTGKGPAIVFLHGFMESHEIWKNYARKLTDSFQILSFDLPGHGASETLPGPHSVDQMAESVNHVLKSLKINACLMVGHSMGGYVTLAFAEKYPKKLKGIVLFHSHAAADIPEIRANRERTIALVEKDRHSYIKNFIPGHFDPANVKKFPQEIAWLKAIADQAPKEGIIASLEAMRDRPDRQHILAQSRVPVLFILGKNDARVPMQIVFPQTTLPEHSEVLLLDHVGHMGFIEAAGKTFGVVKGFAERVL
jgi:pimeloyl-ACP methyl ester carboxylesterase